MYASPGYAYINHPWLQIFSKTVQYLLWQIGLGNIWLQPENWNKKFKIYNDNQTQGYIYIPSFNAYWSANIRSMFTKMHIDANCTLESRLRSFKHNKTEDAMCKECNVHQSVSHILFECNNLEVELTKNRDILNDKLSKFVQHYPSMSEQEKLQTILNLRPLCEK